MCPPSPDRKTNARPKLDPPSPTSSETASVADDAPGAAAASPNKLNGGGGGEKNANESSSSSALLAAALVANGGGERGGGGWPAVVALSPLSLFVLVLACAAASFGAGCASRQRILLLASSSSSGGAYGAALLATAADGKVSSSSSSSSSILQDAPLISNAGHTNHQVPSSGFSADTTHTVLPGIPIPTTTMEQKAPQNRYTFKQFDIPSGVRSNSVVLLHADEDGQQQHHHHHQKQQQQQCETTAASNDGTCAAVPETGGGGGAAAQQQQPTTADDDDDDDDDNLLPPPVENNNNSSNSNNNLHQPSGLHLLVDIENVDSAFLNSEERLAAAMMDLIATTATTTTTTMTMLSYHCHTLQPTGVSCVGVLLESAHVSFHTWPLEGVITLDLFSCGGSSDGTGTAALNNNSLIPFLSSIQELFGVPRQRTTTTATDETGREEEEGEAFTEPRMVWSQKRRGFREEFLQNNVYDVDVDWLLGFMHLGKQHVATVQTDFQKIDVYDLVEPHSGDVDRVVFLDGIIQSRGLGEHAYHESLVHPALFAHANPRRVIIIGAGEGATLREVLKHNTVEEVIMVEIDKGMVDTSRKYLPEWSYCGFLVDSADSCFDDPRATVYYTDAIAWFLNRFGSNAAATNNNNNNTHTAAENDDVFDVIIMDALDPNSVVEFSDLLYNNNALMEAFSRALGDDGIFIAQVGELDNINDPPESLYPNDHFMSFVEGLESNGFESITDYAEMHGRLVDIWSFVLAMKNSKSRANWFMSEAEINLKIAKRSMKTITGESPFHFFDGALMMQYQFASRVVEEVWCRDKSGLCSTGHGYDPDMTNVPVTSFEVRPSIIAKGGRGVFATEFIPKGSNIGLEECVHGMSLPGTTYLLLSEAAEAFDDTVSEYLDTFFFGYVDGYGWVDSVYGLPDGGVDPGIMTFVNHGCNGTYNVGTSLAVTETTIELGRGPEGVYDDSNEVHHPFDERHYPQWECQSFVALRDIEAGEELLDNYLVFGGGDDIDFWDKTLRELKDLCSGGTGTITEYEEKAQRQD